MEWPLPQLQYILPSAGSQKVGYIGSPCPSFSKFCPRVSGGTHKGSQRYAFKRLLPFLSFTKKQYATWPLQAARICTATHDTGYCFLPSFRPSFPRGKTLKCLQSVGVVSRMHGKENNYHLWGISYITFPVTMNEATKSQQKQQKANTSHRKPKAKATKSQERLPHHKR